MTTQSASGILGNYEESGELALPSNKRFGLTVGGIFSGLAAFNFFLKSGNPTFAIFLGSLGFLLLFAGMLFPSSLLVLNRSWMQLGVLLGKITTPILMAIIFFAFVSPLGLLMRICGSRPLNLKFQPDAITYWKIRGSSKFSPESLKRQF